MYKYRAAYPCLKCITATILIDLFNQLVDLSYDHNIRINTNKIILCVYSSSG